MPVALSITKKPDEEFWIAELDVEGKGEDTILMGTMHALVESKFPHLFELWINNLNQIVVALLKDYDPDIRLESVSRVEIIKDIAEELLKKMREGSA